jgi:putative nucleotidyltransferase with HDIG domain
MHARHYPKQYVASGSFVVAPAKPMLLQACLGTCVGLALYDHQARIGAMIHLLLPEPPSAGIPFRAEKYALTGLPLFFEAFYAAGSRREGTSAAIAGGALVGPVSHMDMTLDIGGRTLERVRERLAAEGIAVVRSETGGLAAACLNLDLNSGESWIDMEGGGSQTPCPPAAPPSPEAIVRAIKRLQPVPQVALKILRLAGEADFDIGRIAAEAKQDQVISALTLKLCNSALFARPCAVQTLDHALVLLGRDLFIKLIVSAAVERFLGQAESGGYSLCRGGIFHHALGTAIIAERLAAVSGRADPALAYTAGLLHDIGKVVLDQYIAADFPGFYRLLGEEHQDLIDAERLAMGTDHTSIGARLAETWQFPAALTDVIRCHHAPEDAPPPHRDLTRIVYLADLLMSRFQAGLELERLATAGLAGHLQALGFSSGGLEALVDLIPDTVLARQFTP